LSTIVRQAWSRHRIAFNLLIFGIVDLVLYELAVSGSISQLGLSLVSVFLLLYLATVALDIIWGFAGLFSIAYAPIEGIGAYGAAIALRSGWDVYLALLTGLVVAAAAALVIAWLLRQLRGMIFAIATFGIGLLIMGIINALNWTGGTEGIILANAYAGLPSWAANNSQTFDFLAIAVAGLLVAWLTANLLQSVAGRELVAARENATHAGTLGIRNVRNMLWAAALAGLIAGLAGVLYTVHIKAIDPTSFSVGSLGFNAILALLIGGRTTFWGPVIGAAFVTASTTFLPWQGYETYVAIGAIAILVARLLPRGVAGTLHEQARLWRVRRLPAVPPTASSVDVADGADGKLPRPGGTSEETLDAAGLRFAYTREEVVRSVDLSVSLKPAEIVGIAGPNGAGKSTFMAVLSGALAATSGRVTLAGAKLPFDQAARVRAGLTRVPQDTDLFPDMTTLDAVMVGLGTRERPLLGRSMLGLAATRRRERRLRSSALGLLRDFRLEPWANYRVSELSYGNRRLAALVAAAATQPTVLLLDEPTAGLSPASITNVLGHVQRLARTGVSFVIIDHRLNFLDALTDRIVMMAEGQVLSEASLSEHMSHAEVAAAYLGTVAHSDKREPQAALRPGHGREAAAGGAAAAIPAGPGEILTLDHLSVGYSGMQVLTDVCMTMTRGTIVGWVGPNGAGKTTLGSAAAGLIPVSKGRIRLGDLDVTRLTVARRVRHGITFVSSGRRVFPQMTVTENLVLAARMAHRDGDAIDSMFELFPALKRLARKQAAEMSGGEKQMLVTARGLLVEPKFLIMDEPFAGLSPKVCDDLQVTLTECVTRTGACLILIDQDVSRLASFADQLCMLASGRLQIAAPTGDVLARTDLFQTFLGVSDSALADTDSIAAGEEAAEKAGLRARREAS
jgi:branched-chain amino acid transport system ATP-binding protein